MINIFISKSNIHHFKSSKHSMVCTHVEMRMIYGFLGYKSNDTQYLFGLQCNLSNKKGDFYCPDNEFNFAKSGQKQK